MKDSLQGSKCPSQAARQIVEAKDDGFGFGYSQQNACLSLEKIATPFESKIGSKLNARKIKY